MIKLRKTGLILTAAMLISTFWLNGCGTNGQEQEESTTTEVVTESSALVVESETALPKEPPVPRVVSLKGPTSLGLLNMMEEEEGQGAYEFNIVVDASEAAALLTTGKADIALLPANLAANLYQNTDGQIKVLNINTLGVVYLVQAGEPVASFQELTGKTIYVTGKGTTPDLALQYLLTANGVSLDDVNLEYKSEAAEVVAAMSGDTEALGLLPQPFVTVAMSQNENLQIAFDLTKEWDQIQGEGGSTLVTGVTVVRTEFLETNPEAVSAFLEKQEVSSMKANSDVEGTALLAEKYDIVKEAVALQAIPQCNITYIAGDEMEQKLKGYLEVLFALSPEFIGGEMPDEGFYR